MAVKISLLPFSRIKKATRSIIDEDQNDTLLEKGTQRAEIHGPQYAIIALCIALAISLVINIGLTTQYLRSPSLNKLCSVYTSQYRSPMEKYIDISYETVLFKGVFLNESVYRQLASPEVDEAWQALGTEFGHVIIPEDEAASHGLNPGMIKVQQEDGGGFVTDVEVFHHLHCLDLLRKTSHWNYEYYLQKGQDAFENSEDIVRIHSSHCLDILRQQIMCTADIGVFGQYWVKDIGPFVDFNTQHKCKNFNAIRDWTNQHQISKTERKRVVKRPGDVVLSEIP